jgi:PKD repeat protein
MMQKINLTVLCCVCFFMFQKSFAEKRSMLMIGNSYIYTNDLPTVLKSLALSMGDSLEILSSTAGGATLNGQCSNATTLSLIQQGNWDYVVIQAQSQEPSFPPSQVETQTYPYAKKLDSLIHVSSPCAETIFFMTWGKKNGDASNCAGYPVLCTYSGIYSRLRESYLEMSQTNHATCAPIGAAWDKIITTNPSIELFNADGSHPNVNGTYLAACTFYTTIYHKSCANATYVLSGVNAMDALLFQQTGTNVVFDSLETWQQFGKLPSSKFVSNNTLNQYSFTNQSLRSTQYEWNFGDASAINTQTNPTHTYSSNGTYQVKLKAMNACGNYDVIAKTIQVSNIPNGIQTVLESEEISVRFENSSLLIKGNVAPSILTIFSPNGQLIHQQKVQVSNSKIDLNQLSNGLYFYQIKSQKNINSQGKFLIN